MKFTITIPCYKSQFLAEAIDSVLNQSYQEFELILVNDASPFPVDAVVGKYRDSRIKYIKNKVNCGAYNVVNNWNTCLQYASGDYLIMMGDDDRLDKDCLTTYSLLIDQYQDLNVYHGRTIIIDEKSQFVKLHEARPEWETLRSLMWHRLSGRMQYIGDFLFRRDWLIQNGGFVFFPLAWNSDDMTVFLAAKEKGIANTNTPVFNYRVNSSSISMSSYTQVKMECNKMYEGDVYHLLECTQPYDDTDSLYEIMIKSALPNLFIKKTVHLLSLDFRNIGCWRTIKVFMSLKNKYHLPFWVIILSFIESLKLKKTNNGKNSVV